jgi:hypothetical protein
MRKRGDDSTVIPVPTRLTRPHRVVAALQQAPQGLRVTKGCIGRALRILQALAQEAERRGYTVSPARDKGSAMRLVVHGYGYELTIVEPNLRVPHVPSKQELVDAACWSWRTPPPYDHVPSGELELRLAASYRLRSWRDRKRQRLEDKLPQILAAIEARAELDEQRQLEQERQAQERRRAHREALERARKRLVQAHRAKALAEQIQAWRLAQDIRAFCAATRARLSSAPGDIDREAVGAWLEWADLHADALDPVLHPTGTPTPPRSTPEALYPFMEPGWSPYLEDAPWLPFDEYDEWKAHMDAERGQRDRQLTARKVVSAAPPLSPGPNGLAPPQPPRPSVAPELEQLVPPQPQPPPQEQQRALLNRILSGG